MQANREAIEKRRRARRLREIGMIETGISRDLGEIAADIERQADALERPVIAESRKIE